MNENNDMSQVMENLSSMLNSDNIPDSVKDLLNNIKGNTTSSNSSISNSSGGLSEFLNNSGDNPNSADSNSTGSSQIDMDTMLKIGKIISSINNSQDDDRSRLLLSLKPYLRESKKNKLSQYVKLLNMSRALDIFNDNGGGSK